MKKLLFILPLISFIAFAQLSGDQQNAIVGKVTKVDRLAFTPIPQERGQYTYARDWAALQWEAQTPWIPDGEIVAGKPVLKWPILAYYPKAWYPSIVWYYDGSFRSSNGYKWGVPERWAYVRYWKEEWDPARKQQYVPGLDGPETVPAADDDKPGVYMSDIQGQWMIDDLKRSFTVNKINKMLEASVYDEPDRGAPLE